MKHLKIMIRFSLVLFLMTFCGCIKRQPILTNDRIPYFVNYGESWTNDKWKDGAVVLSKGYLQELTDKKLEDLLKSP